MYAIDEDISANGTVTVEVTDPARSHEFYQDLFGLVLHEDAAPTGRRLMAAPDAASKPAIELRRRPLGAPPTWLSVEVASVSEVLDTYLLAIMMGAKALLPRKRGARWNTVITDPDGNRIAVWTTVDSGPDHAPAPDLRPQRWQWNLAPSGADGAIDSFELRGLRSSEDDADRLPGRCAAGADRVDRRHGPVGGKCALPPSMRDRALKEKE